MIQGIPSTRRGHADFSTVVPDHPVAVTMHASILRCRPATVAVHVAGAAMVMHITWMLPLLCCRMLQMCSMGGLGCTCTQAETMSVVIVTVPVCPNGIESAHVLDASVLHRACPGEHMSSHIKGLDKLCRMTES